MEFEEFLLHSFLIPESTMYLAGLRKKVPFIRQLSTFLLTGNLSGSVKS